MRNVAREDVDRVLTFPALIDALRDAFAGGSESPARHHHEIGAGGASHATHLLMPAWTTGVPGKGGFLGTKIVNIFPDNGHLGLPSVLGVYVLQSGETGAPLAVIDGTCLTHWRTAAASGLAAGFLARSDARRLLLIGAGALAPFLLRAHRSVRPIDHVTLWNHRAAGAEALAASLDRDGMAAEVARDIEPAVRSADIVCCATLATAPLVRGEWLRPGTHLDLVGAFNLGMREADDEALHRARIFVDTPAALSEGGDVALGIRSGTINQSDVVADLSGLCRGTARGRDSATEITLFKSIGSAIEDLAAAMLVWKLLGASEA